MNAYTYIIFFISFIGSSYGFLGLRLHRPLQFDESQYQPVSLPKQGACDSNLQQYQPKLPFFYSAFKRPKLYQQALKNTWPHEAIHEGELHNPHFNPLKKPTFIPEYEPKLSDPSPLPQYSNPGSPQSYNENEGYEKQIPLKEPVYEHAPQPVHYGPEPEHYGHAPEQEHYGYAPEQEHYGHAPEQGHYEHAPEPVHYAPEPVHYAPEPVHYAPEPIHYAPEPVYEEPEPIKTYHAPEPHYEAPKHAPTYSSGDDYSSSAVDSDVPCGKNIVVGCAPIIRYVKCGGYHEIPKRYITKIRSIPHPML